MKSGTKVAQAMDADERDDSERREAYRQRLNAHISALGGFVAEYVEKQKARARTVNKRGSTTRRARKA